MFGFIISYFAYFLQTKKKALLEEKKVKANYTSTLFFFNAEDLKRQHC
jgi:hypothetical protein